MTARRIAVHASDPSVDGNLLVWHEAGSLGMLVRDGAQSRVPGIHPAVGGNRLALLRDGGIDVQATAGDPFALRVPSPGADAVAVSAAWLAWRARESGRDAIYVASLADGQPRLVKRAAELGRPALDGDLLAFHARGRIVVADLEAGRTRTVRRERRVLLLNPSLHRGRLLYVRARHSRQELRLGPATRRRAPRRDRKLWSTIPTGRRDKGREPGARHRRHGHPRRLWKRPRQGLATTVWTTALAADAAYVTVLRQQSGRPLVAELLRVSR